MITAPCRSCSVNPGGAEDYLERFTDALDRPISLGFIVPADRAEIPEVAVATFPGGLGYSPS